MNAPAAANATSPTSLRFEGFELRPDEHTLLIDGQPARIGGRAFEVLRLLAESAGRLVDRRVLLERAWPGRVVEENNLTVQITALRKLLGAEAIVNVAGVGYRLAARPQGAPAPAVAAAAASPAPPPAAGALIGRDAERADLRSLVATAALVTLAGPGGVGKTTLARAAAADAQPPRDGVHWLDLAPLRPGAPLMPLLVKALGVHVAASGEGGEAHDMARALAHRQALVVLDNCEHLLDDVAALVSPLLAQAPGLRWLCTSQQPLRLQAETVYRLMPLALPDLEADPFEARRSGALALLCERARGAGLGAAWSADDLRIAARLCHALDGLPLAIEIAAAHLPSLGLAGVHEQIDLRLRLRGGNRLAPSRQHTLLQTYEWSRDHLSEIEQRVFRSLEPFTGGFTATMVERLHALGGGAADDAAAALAPWEVLDAVGALVDKSLVQAVPGAPGAGQRLLLLESARDFVRLEQQRHGDAARWADAHARVLAAWFAPAADELEHWRDRVWAARYLPERRNLQAALAHACTRASPALVAQLVAALGLVENFAEGESDLVRMPVSLDTLAAADAPLRAAAWLELAHAHRQAGSRELAIDLARRAMADYEALADSAGIFRTLTVLLRLFHSLSGHQQEIQRIGERLRRFDRAKVPPRSWLAFECSASYLLDEHKDATQLRRYEQLCEAAGYETLAALCRVSITDVLLMRGEHEQVVAEAQAMLARGEPIPARRALICHNLALSLVRLSRVDEAHEPMRQVLRAVPDHAHLVLDILALAAAEAGRFDDAALMHGCSAAVKARRGWQAQRAEAAAIEDTRQRLQAHFEPGALAQMQQLGAQMGTDAVLAMALGR